MVKNLPANAGVVTDVGSIPGSRRSPRGGHGNPLQHSCLEKPMDRGAWRAPVQGVTQSRTRLKYLCTRRRRGSSGFSEPFRDTSHTGELPSLSRGSSRGAPCSAGQGVRHKRCGENSCQHCGLELRLRHWSQILFAKWTELRKSAKICRTLNHADSGKGESSGRFPCFRDELCHLCTHMFYFLKNFDFCHGV